ncbi:MAG: hypothetical protein A2X78_01915 [Gammaproteobacteria bacterium GWE2_37_16]|nr:MAG: hypothetical protein A2X78_01915 [Gammaproteobacteria bacterium GWE2_37_16]
MMQQPTIPYPKVTYRRIDGSIERTYEGELVDGIPNGGGTMTYPDGRTITGQWHNGELIQPPIHPATQLIPQSQVQIAPQPSTQAQPSFMERILGSVVERLLPMAIGALFGGHTQELAPRSSSAFFPDGMRIDRPIRQDPITVHGPISFTNTGPNPIRLTREHFEAAAQLGRR